MKAIWPKDGAIVSPIFMLAKKELEKELKPVVDFFASKQVGETLAHNGLFPSLHPNVDNRLPDNTPLMWLGWDKIMSTDLTKQIYRLEKLFNDTVEKGV
jgi:ABC-type Fe3+ transport system substrate-binding protein